MTAPHSDDHVFPPDPDANPDPSTSPPRDRPTREPHRPPAAPERGSAEPDYAAGAPERGSAEPGRPGGVPERGSAEPDRRSPEGARPAGEPGRAPAEPLHSQAGERAGFGVAEPVAPVEVERNGIRPAEGAAGVETDGEDAGADAVSASVGPELGAADVWPPDEALEAVELDDTGWTRRSLEAILLVADEPVPAATLAELVGARLTQVEALLIDLAGEYAGQGRGFVLRAVAGGWRLYTHPATREVVETYLRAGQQSRLTRAALETLAVIAYRQPVTRHQVAAVRGVNVDGVFRTLASRGLIQEVGREEGPGQAALYRTTPAFLEQLGLNSLDQLPPIKDYLPEGVDLTELLEQM
jgi:segregation and condensation protein B